MNRGLVLGLAASLVAVLAVLVVLLLTRPQPQAPTGELAMALATLGVSMDVDGQLTRVDDAAGRVSLLAELGGDRLRLRVDQDLDAAAADARIVEIRAVIDNLFGDRQAPYPGQLSNTLQCPERYQPEELPRGTWARSVIGLYANDRLAYGGCSEDLLRYHATVGFFYDAPGQRLFQVEYFAALDGEGDRGPAAVGSFSLAEGTR